MKSMETEEEVARVRLVKARHEQVLLQKANVVGVGIGLLEQTEQVILVVNVTHKVNLQSLALEDRIPRELEEVPVKVKAIGRLQAQL
ncbi:MAG: hypothetical protein U9R05_04000 [Chloroflexota bacterium]|nr:hypothetical protein [Chloroflexota bacterium]